MKTLIKNGHIVDPKNNIDKIADLLIADGKVAKIGENLEQPNNTLIIDATERFVVPGFIDLHVHLRDPGYTHKETIQTGRMAAVNGGFTTICCMPNTNPVIDNAAVVSYVLNAAKCGVTSYDDLNNAISASNEILSNVLPIGSITKGQQGLELSDIEEMTCIGAVAISEDGKTVMDSKIMKQALKIAAKCNIPVFSHCEDINLAGGVINEGKRADELSLLGISNETEDVIISRDIILANSENAKLHICHISTKGGVSLLREAKAKGQHVSGEVCPHHFALTDNDVVNTNYKMNPPLRSRKDVEAIIKGLCDGTIDVIATDHAPHSQEEKAKSFNDAPFGIVGLETAFPLCVTELVEKGYLTFKQLIEKLTVNPAKVINSDRGSLSIGSVADVLVVDINKSYKIDVNNFKSKGKNSPFDKTEVRGTVDIVIIEGKIAKYDN